MEPSHPYRAEASQDALSAVLDSAPTELADLKQELATRKADHLRLAADFDNFIKRTRRDSEQQAAAQKEAFIGELLPTVDNLERALASGHSDSSNSLHQGVALTLQQLGRLLQRHGIEAIKSVGEPFDPHRHEAISIRHDPHQPDQIVLAETQCGYTRGDKLFRPAMVIVNDLSDSPGDRHAG